MYIVHPATCSHTQFYSGADDLILLLIIVCGGFEAFTCYFLLLQSLHHGSSILWSKSKRKGSQS